MAKTCPWCGRNDGSCDVDAPNVKVVCVEFIDYSHINPDGSMLCECGASKGEGEEFCPSCNRAINKEMNNQKYSNNL